MAVCAIAEADRKPLVDRVGDDLVRHHGKKKYYQQEEVEASLRRQSIPLDWDCWAYAFFLSHQDFDAHHHAIGESCDYLLMKSDLISDVTEGLSKSWFDFDFDLSWLEWPDFDLSSLFDWWD